MFLLFLRIMSGDLRRFRCHVIVLLMAAMGISIYWYYVPQETQPFLQITNKGEQRNRDVAYGFTTPVSPLISTTRQPATSLVNKYVEEPVAGTGSTHDEMVRLRHFVAVQGAVCEDIRRVGGAKAVKTNRPFGPDGAWDVCFSKDVGLVKSSCIVYSFGIGNDFSFDDGMASYGCKVFAFDPTNGMSDHKHAATVSFYSTGLSDGNQERKPGSDPFNKALWKTRNLGTIIYELGHDQKFIDLVKIDIECDEWKCLPQMLKDETLKRYVRQLNIEYHVVDTSPHGIRRYYSIMRWLQRQGFEVFSLHKNPYCSECLEMSYINTKLRGIEDLPLLPH